jgi:hypothetical protein
MEQENFISVNDFCAHHHLELSFIQTLEANGVLETTMYKEVRYLPLESLGQAEQFARLHQEMEIHPEDLDVVYDLLERMKLMQEQLRKMQQQIDFYEQFES